MSEKLKPGELKRIIDEITQSYDEQTGNGDPDISFAEFMKHENIPGTGLLINNVRRDLPPEAFNSRQIAYRTAISLFALLRTSGRIKPPESPKQSDSPKLI